MNQDNSRAAYYSSLPRRRCGAGALFLDLAGRVLIVEPTYKPTWEIPGGVVEAGESPRQTCVRECAEELGIEPRIGRLLALEFKSEPEPMGDSIMFIYDGGVLSEPATISLQETELRCFRFVVPEELEALVSPRLAHRVHCALAARTEGTLAEIIDGELASTAVDQGEPCREDSRP
jgi:ADP-ribose pyrophosphatase YjhB (NUDIX family)